MSFAVRPGQRREPEVHESDTGRNRARLAGGDDQDVRGFEIAVAHAAAVKRLEPGQHARRDVRDRRPVSRRERAVRGQSRHVLHGEERRAVEIDAELVHGHDRGVAHRDERREFLTQRLARRLVSAQALERALGAGRPIQRERHLAHAAAAERPQQLKASRDQRAHRFAPGCSGSSPVSAFSTPSRASGSGTGPCRRNASWNAFNENRVPRRWRHSSRSSSRRHLPSV